MYIPTWLIIIGVIAIYWLYQSKKSSSNHVPKSDNVDTIESSVQHTKQRIFELEHIDSPHFIDAQNAFDAMEVNYFRLKQRFSTDKDKTLELARDWYKYAEALRELKFARVMLDVDWSDDAFDNLEARSKEPHIVKDEIEKKYKPLLGKDWQKIPDDYFERMEKMKEPDKKTKERLGFNEWQYYYSGDKNLYNLLRKRQAIEEEKKKKTENKETK